MERKPFLGVAYYPEAWDRSQICEDLDNMVRHGVGCVRIGEFAWKTMEPQEGKFDFSLFRKVVDECKKRGIYVIMGTPAACPPVWLSKKHPGVYAQFIDGTQGHNGSRRLTCFADENYIYYGDRITEMMAREFGGDENVIGWQIDNEINAVLNEAGCVCPSCVAMFRKWAEKRFGGDIEKFNREVCTGVFSTGADSFDELDRPYKQWTNPGYKALWLQFKQWQALEYISRQRGIIKKYSSAPVGTDTMPTFSALSYAETSRRMDVMQFNHYYYGNYPDVEMWLNYLYNCRKEPFWLTETSCCWNGSERSNYMRPAGFVEMNGWFALVSGAENVNYWLWRTHYGAHELMHGAVIQSNGRDSHVSAEVMRLSREIKEHSDFIADTRPVYSGLYVMLSGEADIEFTTQSLYDLDGSVFRYASAAAGKIARPLLERRLRPAFIPENGDFSDGKVLFTPFITCLENDALGEKILRWVRGGGIWIAGPLTDIRTAAHAKYRDKATGVLEEAADAVIEFTLPAYKKGDGGAKTIGIDYLGVSSEAEQFCFDAIKPGAKAKTIMTYENESYLDGYAAAAETPYGKGKIIMLGCLPCGETLCALIENAAAGTGIKPFAKASRNVSVICREGGYGVVYAFTETNCEKGAFTVPFDGTDILSGKKYKEGAEETINPYGVVLLKKD